MAIGYFDSSVLLSALLNDVQGQRAHALWTQHVDRVSSLLLEIESVMVLRRRLTSKSLASSAEEPLASLDRALEEISLKRIDSDITDRIRDIPLLNGCRALDAIHLATALYFREGAEGDLTVCTFDQRMADIATQLGLSVVGLDKTIDAP